MQSRIIIFDNNKERLNSVAMLLNLTADFICTGTFHNAHNLLADITRSIPDLVLMDLNMPGIDGIEATRLVREHFGTLPVLVQTNFEEDDRIFSSLLVGANGYLPKKTSPERFLESLRESLQGGAPMMNSIAAKVLRFFSAEKDHPLTEMEKQVLRFLIKGYSYKSIAYECGITYNKVNNDVREIYDKLYLNNTTKTIN